ncbi:MAG: LAGLIDADG family homing endonuclease, partial [Gammaproteobacteria bacterium]|nr:LAGLIDADG family homing endonuclease [Gammaproteobacteria bacterium]
QLPPQYVIHASDVELAWVAGIIDGEGCISVIKSKVNKKEGVYFRYQLNIYVGMIHKPTIYRIKDIFKFGHLAKDDRGSECSRTRFIWGVSCNQAEAVLKAILPFMITKKEEARVALEFQENTDRSGGKYPSKGEWKKREYYRQRLKKLKRISFE